MTGLDDGIGQLGFKSLIYSRLDFLNVSILGNAYFDLAMLSFHSAPHPADNIHNRY